METESQVVDNTPHIHICGGKQFTMAAVNKVHLFHERDWTKERNQLVRCTFAVIWRDDLRFVGISRCTDKSFSKKRGIEIALGRATHLLWSHSSLKSSRPSDLSSHLKFSFSIKEDGYPFWLHQFRIPQWMVMKKESPV